MSHFVPSIFHLNVECVEILRGWVGLPALWPMQNVCHVLLLLPISMCFFTYVPAYLNYIENTDPKHNILCSWAAKVFSLFDNVCVCVRVCIQIVAERSPDLWGLWEVRASPHLLVDALRSQDCVRCLNDEKWCWLASWLCYSKTFDEPVM